ncbi:hypothetical protein IIQ_05573 [Bacillus cereus VD118]|uniref:Uncharacterized protein n=1 Tax=Bacillus cereus VD118 TaxID=1053231 RepID=R8QWV5_BACCE|nr:hypothetical protein IG7_05651 [Bacillus cereus HuA2-4]EJR95171.1 hypothetical protein IKO_05776 [Bacillus cereus VDM034]EOP75267.1 hypothetical protein IIQ_05573 [Bacillus cereus VD118]
MDKQEFIQLVNKNLESDSNEEKKQPLSFYK